MTWSTLGDIMFDCSRDWWAGEGVTAGMWTGGSSYTAVNLRHNLISVCSAQRLTQPLALLGIIAVMACGLVSIGCGLAQLSWSLICLAFLVCLDLLQCQHGDVAACCVVHSAAAWAARQDTCWRCCCWRYTAGVALNVYFLCCCIARCLGALFFLSLPGCPGFPVIDAHGLHDTLAFVPSIYKCIRC